MNHVFRLAILGLATTSLINCADADDLAPSDETTIDRNEGRPLTPPSNEPAGSIAREYLRGQVGNAVDQLAVVNEYSARGVTHVRFEQMVDGLRVYGSYAKAAVSARGELLQIVHKMAPLGSLTKARGTEQDALTTSLIEYGYAVAPVRTRARGNVTFFARNAELHREPSVERVAYADGRTIRQGYLVETWSKSNNQLDHTLIGYDGAIVSSERRTNNDSYKVFTEDPGKGGQAVVNGPGAGNAESPAGWLGGGPHTTINISGNNAKAYLDAVSNNSPDTGGTAVTTGDFLTAANLEASPSTAGNREVAVQNLFYLNNVIHDTLYRHGFNEANGNFQTNNFGLGGAGNDAVLAEAQDGGGTDNANFATPADGSAPRMQMYLWSGSAPSAEVVVGATNVGAYPSSFGNQLNTTGVAGALALGVDSIAPAGDACTALTASLTGKIALVDRGTCDFTVKVKNAQTAGASAVIIVNNVSGLAFGPGGTDRKVTIPSAMVSQADGATLAALAGASATLRKKEIAPVQVDGDLDADIVFHEYGHGLTWRMIGGMNGVFAGAIGEGASDTLAFLVNGDDRIGEYSAGDPAGIRRQPYQGYTLTYANWTGASVHDDGEIYAAAMWGVYENYLAAGLTADHVLEDFVDGMNFTPATPKPENMRDGMLQAAGTDRACLVWRGFARVGIGEGAAGSIVFRKGKSTAVVTQSFTVPAICNP